MTLAVELVVDSRCQLAEGIQWHVGEQRLYWTDIHGSALWSANAEGGDVRTWPMPERVGSFAFDANGDFLLAMESGFAAWRPGIAAPVRISTFEPDVANTRFNDGRCDRAGNFIAGGVHERGLEPVTSLQRIAPDGTIETLLTGIGCANSLAFSLDGSLIYFTDSPTRRIDAFRYAPTFEADSRCPLYQLPDGAAIPDGSCIDAEGGLWNAEFNGYAVQRYRPNGDALERIELPVAQVTCCCFGGAELDWLYISTAREHLSEADVAAQPHAGGIFRCRPGPRGVPEDQFGGRVMEIAGARGDG
ncbi:MAG: SMP-30/gluconolactonase/LRE family protein [Pseudomonadota bacterium]